MKTIKLVSLLILPLLFYSCGKQNELELPTPPNLTPLLEAFKKPTGELTKINVLALKEKVEQNLQSLKRSGNFDTLFQSLEKAFEDKQKEQANPFLLSETQDESVAFSAYIKIKTLCTRNETETALTSGSLDITGLIKENQFHPVFWGEFVNCLIKTDSDALKLSANINLYLSDLDKNSLLDAKTYMLSTVGSLSSDTEKTDFDFALIGQEDSDTLNFLLDSGTGLMVAILDPQKISSEIKIRATNGSFTCNWKQKSCSDPDGKSISW